MPLLLPNDIEPDSLADATELQQNYQAIQSYINTEVIQRNGSVAMTSPLLLPGAPTQANQAATKAYADSKLDKDGGSLTGDLWLPADTAQLGVGYNPGDTPSLSPGILLGTGTTAGRVYSNSSTSGTPNLVLSRVGAAANAGDRFASFQITNASTQIGSITMASGSSVAYNTTSDARLKERTADADDALDVVAQLGSKVYRGRWIADEGQGEEFVFLNSQDAEPLVAFAVTGAADGAEPQQLDHTSLVPLLLAAVQQLTERVVALENA